MKSNLTTEEKIKRIKRSKNLSDLRLEEIPATNEIEYFFVSYSHKDYKAVYEDILKLQEEEVPIWYDKGRLPSGEEWEKTIALKVSSFACKGVIFYISENTVVNSKQIEKELKIVLKTKKPYISINLPVKSKRNVKGEYFSAKGIAELFSKPESLLTETFNDNRIFIPYNLSSLDKWRELNAIKQKIEALEYDYTEESVTTNLKGTRDTLITSAVIPDMVKTQFKSFEVIRLGASSLSNCIQLQTVVLSDTIKVIDDYAFFNCGLLNDIKLNNAHIYKIGKGAFENCTVLAELDLSNDKSVASDSETYLWDTEWEKEYTDERKLDKNQKILVIKSCAFRNCGLEKIIFPKNTKVFIESNAFDNCGLKSFSLSRNMLIRRSSFRGCKLLKELIVEEGVVELRDGDFCGCSEIEKISLPSTLLKIDRNFNSGGSKESFNFKFVEVAKDNPVYRAENNCLIERSGEKLISWFIGNEIPDTVKIIGKYAISDCLYIGNLKIPEGVEEIEDGALSCIAFGTIILPQSLKKLNAESIDLVYAIKDSGETLYFISNKNLCEKRVDSLRKSLVEIDEIIKNEDFKPDVRVIYNGSVDQWKAIVGTAEMFKKCAVTIECADGSVEYKP